jgi:alkanesulfonate monooxygenase SsuD/methylene tetrahydromethanopterin reductase-like flavin-dependent oxidoreductase (luciferase family)
MDVGIGLPAAIRGVEGQALVEWARQSDKLGFSSLAVLDRMAFANYEPLVTLAAAAAVTVRIRLVTSILITPYRPNAALLAKQIASLQRLSGYRLVLGVGIGNRAEDYTVGGLETKGRGDRLVKQLAEMQRIWAGENSGARIGPEITAGGSPLLLMGGGQDWAVDRAARLADGWMAGAGGASAFYRGAGLVKEAWAKHDRAGKPRLAALSYFSFGSNAKEQARAALGDYYGHGAYTEQLVGRTSTDMESVRTTVAEYAAAGCDDLILFPCSSHLSQVELLAEALE